MTLDDKGLVEIVKELMAWSQDPEESETSREAADTAAYHISELYRIQFGKHITKHGERKESHD